MDELSSLIAAIEAKYKHWGLSTQEPQGYYAFITKPGFTGQWSSDFHCKTPQIALEQALAMAAEREDD